MKFQRVISSEAGCEPNCPEWISAEGSIVQGTASAFKQFLDGLGNRRLPILLNSPGGSTIDGVAMGRLIRARHLITAIARTVVAPCASACGEAKGAAYAFYGVCASACSLVFAGGERRYVVPTAFLGVHQSMSLFLQTRILKRFEIKYRLVNGVKEEISRTEVGETRTQFTTKQANAPAAESQMAAYFRDMGIGPQVHAIAAATPPTEIHWLTAEEKVSSGIVTHWIDQPNAFVEPGGAGLSGVSVSAKAETAPDLGSPKPTAAPITARGQWLFPLPVNGRQIMLFARFAYKVGEQSVEATLETHFRDLAFERIFTPEVRGRGFAIRIAPDGGEYQLLKYVAGDPLTSNLPRAAFCKLAAGGRVVIEPFDGPSTHIDESQATANPHEPPISIEASGIDGMPDLLAAACGNPAASVAAKP